MEASYGTDPTAHILVVDDHPLNRKAFEAILTAAGYRVSLAESGWQALNMAFNEDFSVILMDVRMPEMDGIETATHLRKRDRTRHTPIIFVSAHEQTAMHLWKGYVAGATDYLFSPVDEEVLKFKVAAFARLQKRMEQLKLRVHNLSELVKKLQAEVERLKQGETLRDRIDELEDTIDVLKRELAEVS